MADSNSSATPPSSQFGDVDINMTPVNASAAARGLWLVKVPKYLSQEWEKHEGESVGKLVVEEGRRDIKLISTISVPELGAKGGEEHSFLVRDAPEVMTILVETPSPRPSLPSRLQIQGRVVNRCDIQPTDPSDSYMKMKAREIESAQPQRMSRPLESTRDVYRSRLTTMPEELAARQRAKKEQGLRSVMVERDTVRDLIFEAFQKHQYYRFIDLQKLIGQPALVVKDVLDEIGLYNIDYPHKSLWELKPQYRHYNSDGGGSGRGGGGQPRRRH